MLQDLNENYIQFVSNNKPYAQAYLRGSSDFPNIRGYVSFYKLDNSVLVTAYVEGLPKSDNICRQPVFGFHIHTGSSCTGNAQDQFSNTGKHFNPANCVHPYHAGDMPPLFGVYGEAWASFVTSRFLISEIINRTVIIHEHPDDFTEPMSGNSGRKIACGVIRKV